MKTSVTGLLDLSTYTTSFNTPEDPTFYANGQALLWTITHEVWAYLLLTEEEADTWRAQGFTLDASFEAEPPTRHE